MSAVELDAVETVRLLAILAELHDAGYEDAEEHNELKPGARVRHVGHRWPTAYERGTGTVVAVTRKPDSSWSRSWGMPDVELVVAYDSPTLPGRSRLATLAQYHVQSVVGAS